MHVSGKTFRDGQGVVRTRHGPITVDQLRHFLGDSPAIKVYPVYDPADTAAVDNYEIPVALRRSQLIKNPASIFPFSPATCRMDLDHTAAYEADGPPGQTSMANLGPLTRSEHRAKTVGGWRRTTGSRALRLAIARGPDRSHHQPRHPCARRLFLHPPPLAHRRQGPVQGCAVVGSGQRRVRWRTASGMEAPNRKVVVMTLSPLFLA